jgi:hypothetical protein
MGRLARELNKKYFRRNDFFTYIHTTLDCNWCRDSSGAGHCKARVEDAGGCAKLEDPKSRVQVLENADIDPESRDNIVLIQPQKVKVQLRPGRVVTACSEELQSKCDLIKMKPDMQEKINRKWKKN